MQTQSCNNMKIVFLLTVFWIQTYIVTGASPKCCTFKNVGGLEYFLLRVEDLSQHNCLTNCVYEKVGDPYGPLLTYCFGAGDQKVECKDEASATNSPDKSDTGFNIPCGDELVTIHNGMTASNYTYQVQCCDNGTTQPITTCGNGTKCEDVCGNITCADFVQDFGGQDYCGTTDVGMVISTEGEDLEIWLDELAVDPPCWYCNRSVNSTYCGPFSGSKPKTIYPQKPKFICPGPLATTKKGKLVKSKFQAKCCKCKNFKALKDCCTTCTSCAQYYKWRNECPATGGTGISSATNPDRYDECGPRYCRRGNKCCLLVNIGNSNRYLGCPQYC